LTFKPAAANTGVVFVRTDLTGNPKITAVVQNRINGPRRTTLVANGCSVEMVEHVLSALAGLRIDNCEVHVDRAEMPGFDGSSKAFVQAIQSTEIVELAEPKRSLAVDRTIRVGDEHSWILAEPSATDELELIYQLGYDCRAIGEQVFQTKVTPEIYAEQIGSARTFVLESEALELQQKGLGKRVSYRDIMVFNDDGLIDNELRFENECARHKVLDMIGDFSLSDTDLVGKFTACKSGHRLNSRLVFELLQQIGIQERARIPA
jgi:UDP-3-O-acyl N-acetylglucosamine deacetylase